MQTDSMALFVGKLTPSLLAQHLYWQLWFSCHSRLSNVYHLVKFQSRDKNSPTIVQSLSLTGWCACISWDVQSSQNHEQTFLGTEFAWTTYFFVSGAFGVWFDISWHLHTERHWKFWFLDVVWMLHLLVCCPCSRPTLVVRENIHGAPTHSICQYLGVQFLVASNPCFGLCLVQLGTFIRFVDNWGCVCWANWWLDCKFSFRFIVWN